ncbi:hypothetical protein [Haladaptatus sp. DYSN1]|uniref:hypothetical protein n=1 Tax=unclassified Haladaptatus TaxID=2622732 RepID=UPI0024059252|nr:hypothetical protein [Haladaptatus sp. DYSN1]
MTPAILTRFKHPAYTGENRCFPCTAVNLAIAGAASALLTAWSTWAAFAVFVACLSVIYFRGYLAPGTPTLTKRYLPARIHRLFGTHGRREPPREGAIDIETELSAVGIVSDDGDDLVLSRSFRRAWDDAIASIGTDSLIESLEAFLETDGPLFIEDSPDRIVVRAGDRQVGNWESQAALLADVAAHQTLVAQFPSYLGYDLQTRARMVGAIRIFLDVCPTCGGPVEIGEEVVESCCRAFDVVAFVCEECGVRLAEFELVDAA